MMKLAGGFYSDEHAEAFATASISARLGGVDSRVCGARTRTGGICRHPPLVGGERCLRHAGPHHARLHRQRQLRALANGQLAVQTFVRMEERRAANALRNAWRRDPWTPGQTIDLGKHEEKFLAETGIARVDAPIAPAVLDWLRWRYRRLQVDRRRDEEWWRTVRDEYPRRVRDAGARPPEYYPATEGPRKPLWTASAPAAGSKRLRGDAPHAPALSRNAALKPSYYSDIEVSEADLARVAYEQRDVLAPLLKLCSLGEQRALIRALAIYLDRPTDLAAMRKWTAFVTEIRRRA